MKFLGLFILIVGLFFSVNVCADLQAGIDAIVRRDFTSALTIIKPLAEQGNVAAQINLGNLYMKGWGVEQNYHLAQHWYLKAADQGERMAQTKLGILYYYGLGIDKDLTEASRWFQKAAEAGETSAQTILGSLYASGDGVAKNPALAFYWYTMAEEQGEQEAAKGRQSLEDEITPGQRDEALRLMGETRKIRAEKEAKAFEAATAGLGTPPQASSAGTTLKNGDDSVSKAVNAKKRSARNKTTHKPENK